MTQKQSIEYATEVLPDGMPTIYIYSPGRDFIRPYFERLMPEYEITDTIDNADVAVMISSTDVYDLDEGKNINEFAPLKSDCTLVLDESHFIDSCNERNIPFSVLRCAPIVCTGMQGSVRTMAEQIYRGTYIGLSGNEAVRSFVHGSDVPAAARATIGLNDIFNVTDDSDTLMSDIADALAWRMSQKRIFSLNAKWYKLLFGKKKMNDVCRSLCFSIEKIKSTGKYNPTSVVEYLKTHVYNEQSL